MAIFARRAIQKRINQLKRLGILSEKNLKKAISEINSNDPTKSIAQEWEFVVLSSLSEVVNIEYEKKFIVDGRQPDIYCSLPSGIDFLADITTISDKGLHLENPIDYFLQELKIFFRKCGVPYRGIDLKVHRRETAAQQKVKLLLPSKGNIKEFIKKTSFTFYIFYFLHA